MSSDTAISIEGLSKCYQIYDKPQHRLLQGLWRGRRQFYREFWALKDVSFEVRKGETVGIIGRNGSGKSTLLQLIAGTLSPSGGNVMVQGRVAALLELGSGFNPDFTGRENVFLNGAILGMTEAEMRQKFDAIAEFADIGDFIDQPVKTYSSGMLVRLAFAVSVHVDPDILIVDEALAVGDAAFQFKCTDRLDQLTKSGTTLLFVSHDISTVRAFCNNVLYLEHGMMKAVGLAEEVTELYLMDMRNEQKQAVRPDIQLKRKHNTTGDHGIAFGSDEGRIVKSEFTEGGNRAIFQSGAFITIRTELEYLKSLLNPTVSVLIQDRRLTPVIGRFFKLVPTEEAGTLYHATVECAFKADLAPGNYYVTIRLEERLQDNRLLIVDKHASALSFDIFSDGRPAFLGLVDVEMNFKHCV